MENKELMMQENTQEEKGITVQTEHGLGFFDAGQPSRMWASFDTTSEEGQVKAYNAVSDTTYVIADLAGSGQVIEVVDFMMHDITRLNEETGEMEPVVRVVLIDSNGDSYSATGTGVVNSLKSLTQIKGMPSAEKPFRVTPVYKPTRNNGHKTVILRLA
ncbi:hypothetical protein PMI08_03167 [Brevibacillus sp. CF112]|uniref:hypothetical protein n=1 Tax=Brevibacillus sp. CF112 TaxID=1144311 RepID=UPI000271881F|nr:hypothetical protein [Brevibacillus sp. CF112]EJL42516.1 hypothetical protein PMI08_03167 [Brevibacillus sp. CF112]